MRWSVTASVVFLLLWPFAMFFQVVMPVGGKFLRVGNDFDYLYYVYKPYLLANLSDGNVPLWMPQEASGFPFAANPFTQTFYPLNWLLIPIAKLNNGWTLLDHQRFTVLGIALIGLAIFFLVRQLTGSTWGAFSAALIVDVSYKVIELIRFPNAAHAAAWIAFVLLSTAFLRSTAGRLGRVFWTLGLAFSIFSLCTSGYPYFVVYLFVFLPAFLLFLEFGAPREFELRRRNRSGFVLDFFTGLGAGLLASSPYLLAMRSLLSATTDRSGGSWAYATMHRFDLLDYLESLVLPTNVSFEGWFYFGTVGFALILAWALSTLGSGSANKQLIQKGLWLLSLVVVVVFFGLGGSNPLFWILWEFVPPIDSLRVWGRINILLIFPIAIAIGQSIKWLSFELRGTRTSSSGVSKIWRYLTVSFLAILVSQIVLLLFAAPSGETTAIMVEALGGPTETEHIIFTFSAFSISLATYLVLKLLRKKSQPLRAVGLTASSLLGVIWIVQLQGLVAAPWMWIIPEATQSPAHPSQVKAQNLLEIESLALEGLFDTRRSPEESGAFNPNPPWATNTFANWHFDRYSGFLAGHPDSPEARNFILGVTVPSRLYFYETNQEITSQIEIEDLSELWLSDFARVDYDGDNLAITLSQQAAGFLVFADNWDENWRAKVNGEEVDVIPVLGTFKGVYLQPGVSDVQMSYCPAYIGWINSSCQDFSRD